MTDRLQEGLTILDARRHAYMTHEVTYVRGDARIQVNATVGRSIWEDITTDGLTRRMQMRDYIVRAEDLVIGELFFTPLPTDTIVEEIGGADRVYQVTGHEQSPPYSEVDPMGAAMRIHTTYIGDET